MVAPNKVDSDLISMNEIYASIQGEGLQIGRPVIFTRVSKCNMSCWFCDTNYEPSMGEYTPDQLVSMILREADNPVMGGELNVLFTGGEPTIYNLEPVLIKLKNLGAWIGIESNGVNDFSKWSGYIDHITISPKAAKGLGMRLADEVRLVTQDFVTINYMKQLETTVYSHNYFLSPMEVEGKFQLGKAYQLLHEAKKQCQKKWTLSLQTHKLSGIR